MGQGMRGEYDEEKGGERRGKLWWICVGVITMVAWRDSQIVVVTYTACMHARMRRTYHFLA